VQRLRIKVRAYEHKVLDASVKQILDTALRYDAKVAGPIPLPTEIKKYTVNRSTFVYKDAREQFEMRIHKRVIDILDPTPKVIEALTNLSLPSGVTIDVKMRHSCFASLTVRQAFFLLFSVLFTYNGGAGRNLPRVLRRKKLFVADHRYGCPAGVRKCAPARPNSLPRDLAGLFSCIKQSTGV
jgi:small subunit ribosomal protein S10